MGSYYYSREDQMALRTIGEITLQGYRCRCGHEWAPRNRAERPRVCPKCKSPNWDRPKRKVRAA